MKNKRLITLGDAIREGLDESMARDESVFLMGEGITDKTAMFGTTNGLIDKFGEHRAVEMPVSENGLVGVAIGASMFGRRPVINFHRVEFALLALEQIFNNAAKMHFISNERHSVPLVIRMVIGRGWGQGPEHSQSLESIFAHVPGLKVVMPTFAADAKGMITAAIEDNNPVIYIEHRWLHNSSGHVPEGYYRSDLDGPKVIRKGADATVVTTSYMGLEALHAAEALAEISCSLEVVDMRVLRPFKPGTIVDSVRKTGHLMTVDTGWVSYGVGAEVVATVVSSCFGQLKSAPVRLGTSSRPTPSSRGYIPGFYADAEKIVRNIGLMLDIPKDKIELVCSKLKEDRGDLPIDVPDPYFRGPF